MKNAIGLLTVYVALLICITPMHGEETKSSMFNPNYIAVEDVTLSSPNGKSLSKIGKGTLVSARNPGAGTLDLKTEDGKFGLANRESFSRLGSNITVTDDTRHVAEASNQFAFDLYQQARKTDGNLFLSPASVSTALAMTYAGAAGRTEQKMASVLHFDRKQNTHEGFSSLLELLNSTGDRNGYSLSTANRLWGVKGYKFEEVFLKLTGDKYRAELETVDFGQLEEARREINKWVERQTREKITDLIPSGVLTPDTRLVLTNAIYFQSGWSSEFYKKATKAAPFRLTATDEVDVLTMQQTEDFPYTEDADVQVLSLPYRGHELSMVVILPKKVDGLAGLEEKLNHDQFAKWMKTLQSDRPVETYLPKFRMRTALMLSKALKSMGMSSAFSDDADFSAMSKSEGLKISEVIHQAFVDVDEKGTEAAAATAVVMAPTSAAIPNEPPKPVVFRADHPFLFVIRDNRTGAILFMGRMVRPDEA